MIKKLVRDKKCARNDTPSPETLPSFEGYFLASLSKKIPVRNTHETCAVEKFYCEKMFKKTKSIS
jgi:hypothetical protein